MQWQRRKRADLEIAPDEIFLDASNVPDFDRNRFEGRLEKPLPDATFSYLTITLLLLVSVVLIRSWNLQVTRGHEFAAASADNSLEARPLFASRGVIQDMYGVAIAENIEREDGSVARLYPFPSTHHLTGYVSYPKKDSKGRYYDTNLTGISGLEAEHDAHLSGENGQFLTETDALGKVRSEGLIVRPVNGKALQLSIDVHLQESLWDAIQSIARDKQFIAGAGVILDTHTGAVRALVSYPSYDANIMASGGPSKTIASYYRDPGQPFLDHAMQGVYAPGSIVKPFVAAGALTDGIITEDTIIDDPGSISIPDPYRPGKSYVFRGWKVLGLMDVRSAIAWSSDIYFYTISGGFGSVRGLGIERLAYWYSQFGLGAVTGIGLPGEAKGLIPTPAWKKEVLNEPWYLGDTYFSSIGQYSVQVTPLQMARATAALVNGGILYTPTLVVGEPSAQIVVPVDSHALQVVREGMRETVTVALAQRLDLPYVTVAAKTGTAQTGVRNEFDNSWVVGYFPYEEPQYAFAVVLERGPGGTGSQAVNAMRKLFVTLHESNSPYVGGTATTTPL